jgi:hypothetical protein
LIPSIDYKKFLLDLNEIKVMDNIDGLYKYIEDNKVSDNLIKFYIYYKYGRVYDVIFNDSNIFSEFYHHVLQSIIKYNRNDVVYNYIKYGILDRSISDIYNDTILIDVISQDIINIKKFGVSLIFLLSLNYTDLKVNCNNVQVINIWKILISIWELQNNIKFNFGITTNHYINYFLNEVYNQNKDILKNLLSVGINDIKLNYYVFNISGIINKIKDKINLLNKFMI